MKKQGFCDRCKQPTLSYTMSFFNTEEICPECDKKERAHPKFKEAHDKEVEEVKKGNYNFPGIGKPDDL